jgi:hypothetical protein
MTKVISRQVAPPAGSEITTNKKRMETIRFNPKRIVSKALQQEFRS